MSGAAVTGDQWDAIVVGAGHNGLTAGALLARAGLSTLVLERRDVIGGACVTEEIAAGCRASTTSYIASMLRPEVIRTLELGKHGLRMVPCEPAVQVALEGGEVLANWTDQERTRAEITRYSARDARAFEDATSELRQLSARLQPMLTELPPDTRAGKLRGAAELVRLGGRLRGLRGPDIEGLTRLVSSSLGDYIDARFTSPQVKALLLANNLYGKHGGPYQPGTLIGLVFHMLTGGDHEEQGFFGHVIGGMGAISDAIAAAGRDHGLQIRTGAEVAAITVAAGRATGVALADGSELTAGVVLSCADPKRTFLQLVDEDRAARRVPRRGRGDQDGRPVRQGQPRARCRARPCWACRRTLVQGSGRCSRFRRAWTSLTGATTGPSAARSPTPTSCSSTAWSPPASMTPWPRPDATS